MVSVSKMSNANEAVHPGSCSVDELFTLVMPEKREGKESERDREIAREGTKHLQFSPQAT